MSRKQELQPKAPTWRGWVGLWGLGIVIAGRILDLRDGRSWCHRRILADWILEHAGVVVSELADPSPVRSGRGGAQTTMFDEP
jgi:hypothetical protein